MASPSSPAALSDAEMPSSPARPEKSFMTNATEDDDTRMGDATPEPSEKQTTRGKGRSSAAGSSSQQQSQSQSQSQQQSQQQVIGKIRHLKKNDGEPLWRADIQYDFLKAVFDDEEKVFTNSFEPDRLGKQNFADLYIDTMSRSSKTSKVLRDKLLSDRDAAKLMAMVCLLVNVGRMNTTLNFFPEMRALLRTYHSIPSLQAHQDTNSYKQLQDAPRLKSILKGGAEDRPEPTTLDQLKAIDVPRTNPVNLLFVICGNASKIAELHFPVHHEFHDLVMKTQYSSASRAKAFLWIMWFYLESDFTEEGCEENPFGPGVDYGLDVANQGVPRLLELNDDDPPENVDPPDEIEFGEEKKRIRAKIVDADKAANDSQSKRGTRPRASLFAPNGADDSAAGSPGVLPRIRPSRQESDMDSTRSTPPPARSGRQLAGPVGGSSAGGASHTGRRSGGASLKYQLVEAASSPAPQQPLVVDGIVARKPRPPTAHQLAVERNRSMRVEHILDRGMRRQHHYARKKRKAEGAIYRAVHRLGVAADPDHPRLPDPFEDSEGEEVNRANREVLSLGYSESGISLAGGMIAGQPTPYRSRGPGGLCFLRREEDDYGEEAASYTAALRRAMRRLDRWSREDAPDGVVATIKRRRLEPTDGNAANGRDPNETEDDMDQTYGVDDSMMMADDDGGDEVSMLSVPSVSSRRRRGGPATKSATKRRSGLVPSTDWDRVPRRSTGLQFTPKQQRKMAGHSPDSDAEDTPAPARKSAAAGRSRGTGGKVNGRSSTGGGGKRGAKSAPAAEVDDLDDVDKELLGIASGDDDVEDDDAEEPDHDDDHHHHVKTGPRRNGGGDKDVDDEEGEDLDDLDKTLLGIGSNSDSSLSP